MTTPTTTPTGSVRVAGVYATRWRYRHPTPDKANHAAKGARQAEAPPEKPITFHGTRFNDFAKAFEDQLNRLPKLIAPRKDVTSTFRIESPGVAIDAAEVYLFALPSDQVVACLVLDCTCAAPVTSDPDPLDAMLDRFTEVSFTIDGEALPMFLKGMVPPGVENLTNPYNPAPHEEPRRRRRLSRRLLRKPPEQVKAELRSGLPERHEVVYISDRDRALTPQVRDRLLYREKARHQKEFSRQEEVKELTENQGTVHKLGVVTTRASLLQGHDPLVETSTLLSTVQAVGTLARFRDIWDHAYELVQDFRRDKLENTTGAQQRDDLESLVDQLGNLEFDLTFSVEFPLMRIETYHTALSRALDVPHQATRLSAMFAQIGGSVKSEITAIDIREKREKDLIAQRNALANQWFAFIGVPIGALLAFFGINALEVRSGRSIFDLEHYKWAYVAAFVLAFLPGTVLWITKWVARATRHRKNRKRARERERERALGGKASVVHGGRARTVTRAEVEPS